MKKYHGSLMCQPPQDYYLASEVDAKLAEVEGEADEAWSCAGEWKKIAERAEKQVAELVKALEMAREEIRKFGHAVRCGYGKPGSGPTNPIGACTCGHFKTLMEIDALLASAKSKGEKP